MRISSFWIIAAGSAALLWRGLSMPPACAEDPDDAARTFVRADGFSVEDPAGLEADLAETLWGRGTGRPLDFDLSAIEKAILVVDRREAPLDRTRYLLHARVLPAGETWLIEVERYNLGPVLRADAVASYGKEHVAAPEVFGVGPDVAWRFAMRPRDGAPARLAAAARRVIDAKEAARRSCPAGPCLSLDGLDAMGTWRPADLPADPEMSTAYDWRPVVGHGADRGRQFAPAYQAFQLGRASGQVVRRGEVDVWSPPAVGAGEPAGVVIVLDRNIGDETMIDGALGIASPATAGPRKWYRLTGVIVDKVETETGAVLDGTAPAGAR